MCFTISVRNHKDVVDSDDICENNIKSLYMIIFSNQFLIG